MRYQLADILLSRGAWFGSDIIARATAEDDARAYSHAALFVAGDPVPLVIEAVPPRINICSLESALERVAHAVLMSPINLSADDRTAMVRTALKFEGHLYGILKFLPFTLDAMLGVDWCSQYLNIAKSYPVCSVLVASAYETVKGWDFHEPSRGVTPNELAAYGRAHPEQYALTHLTAGRQRV